MTTRDRAAEEGGLEHEHWNEKARDETPQEQLDRNWEQLLQELRVTQTGVQIFAGLLVSLPFQNRFERLADSLRWVYFGTVVCAIGATVLITSPVAMHRLLFRRGRIGQIVTAAHHFVAGGLALLALALVGAVVLAVGVAQGMTMGIVAGALGAAMLGACWLVYPLVRR